jgi:predicted ArsR family transcriptional regulator
MSLKSEEKPVKRETYEKKQFVEIRKRILESLNYYPKNVDEIAKEIGSANNTVKNHLHYLWELGIVVEAEIKIGKGTKKLWMLRK